MIVGLHYIYLPVLRTWLRIDAAHDRHWHPAGSNDL